MTAQLQATGTAPGYAVDAGAGTANFVVRRFTGTGWGPPATVADRASKFALHEDPSGGLHALWTDASGLHDQRWSPPQTVATGETFAFPRVAVNTAGNGWAVRASGPNVRAVPLTRATIYTGPTRGV